MASRNAQDAVSLIQTADGALGEIHNIVQRMRELSVQAANDTNTFEDRQSIQVELTEMADEINSISEKTTFNNIKLLDGSQASMTKSLKSHLENGGSGIIFREEISEFSTTQSAAGSATKGGYQALKDVLSKEIVPQAVKSITETYSETFGYLNSSSIGIGLKLYSENSSTLAYVGAGWANYGSGQVVDNMMTYTLGVNLSSLSFDSSGNLTEACRKDLETTIVHEMVHALMDETLTNGMLGVSNGKLDSNNKFPGWFAEGMAQTASGGYSNGNDWVNRGLGITENTSDSQISSIIKSSKNSLPSGSTSSEYGTGYLASMYLGHMASGAAQLSAKSLADGIDKVLSSIKDGKSLNTVISEVSGGRYRNVAEFERNFGDAASAKFVADLTKAVGDKGNGGLASGNLQDDDILTNAPHTTPLFKLDTDNETIKNIYPSDVKVFGGGGSTVAVDGTTTNNGAAAGAGIAAFEGLNICIGANEGQSMKISIDSASAGTLGIGNLSAFRSKSKSS